MVVIIRGCAGVGKTTLTRALAHKHKPSIHIAIDELHNQIVGGTLSHDDVSISLKAAGKVTRYYIDLGYSVFIDYVFVRAWELDEFIGAAGLTNNIDVLLFTIIADIGVLKLRDNGRKETDRMGFRVETLYEELQRSDELRGFTIDTSNMGIEQTVEVLERAIINQKGRIYKLVCNNLSCTDITEAAALNNRIAWDSYRQQREQGLVINRNAIENEIKNGKSFIDKKWIELLGDVHNKKILDMGCGDGAESLSWASLGAQVVGVDNSPMQIKAAKKSAEALKLSCEFILSDILCLSEEMMKSDYDYVFSAWVHAWIGDLNAWFSNVYKSLKPGGKYLYVGTHPVTKFASEIITGEISDSYRKDYFNEGVFIRHEKDMPSSGNPARDNFTTYQWCYTLTSLFNALNNVGFKSIEFIEVPTDRALECEQLNGMPMGILILAIK